MSQYQYNRLIIAASEYEDTTGAELVAFMRQSSTKQRRYIPPVKAVATTKILCLRTHGSLPTPLPHHCTNHKPPPTTPEHRVSSKEALYSFIIPRERTTLCNLNPFLSKFLHE
jgi:hypothetical protein